MATSGEYYRCFQMVDDQYIFEPAWYGLAVKNAMWEKGGIFKLKHLHAKCDWGEKELKIVYQYLQLESKSRDVKKFDGEIAFTLWVQKTFIDDLE